MRINVSAVKTFLYDQQDWYYSFVLRRVPRRPESALELGSLWHVLMEEFTKTGSREKAEEEARLAVQRSIAGGETDETWPQAFIDDYLADVEQLFNLFDRYKERYEFQETLAVEAAIEAQLLGGPHILVGRPDRVVRYQDKLWHVQNRTLSDRTNMPIYLAAAERDLHELAYAYLIQRHFGISEKKYGGTLMNIVRKVSRKKLAEDPDAAFIQEFIPIDPAQVARAVEDIIRVADDMAAIVEGRREPIENRDTDKGRFGNRLSPYFGVKSRRENILDDRLFKTATSRYEAEASAEAMNEA